MITDFSIINSEKLDQISGPKGVLIKLSFRLIQYLSALLILSLVCSLILGWVSKKSNQGYRGFLNSIHSKPEVVILGASRALHHYATPQLSHDLGMTTCNLGVGGSSVLVQYTQLKEILKRYKPKLVIYEIIGGDFNESYMAKNLEYLKLFPDNSFLRMARQNEDEFYVIGKILPLYRYNGSGLELILRWMRPSKDIYLGYKPKYTANLPLLLRQSPAQTDHQASEPLRNGILIDAFESMLGLAREQQLNVLFIRSPLYDKSKHGYPADDSLVFQEIQHHGYTFHDYAMSTDPEFRDPESYSDFVHLTDNGAKFFTKLIMPLVREALAD